MNVLIDSPIWSLALRRKTAGSPEAAELAQLVQRENAHILGVVRQEVLSGISNSERFVIVREKLRAFPDLPITAAHHERAAEFHNACRARGIQGSHIDFLICAAAHLHKMVIFTTDADFQHFAKHLPIRLHVAPSTSQ